MNVLSPESRARIFEMQADGATAREIAAAVGVSRGTVQGYGIAAYRRKVLKLLDAIFTELESKGIDPGNIDALLSADGEIGFSCPLHPEADPDNDFDWEGDRNCLLCHSDGLKRHHARRKAEGRPILPPWQRKAVEGAPPAKTTPTYLALVRGIRGEASVAAPVEHAPPVRKPPPDPPVCAEIAPPSASGTELAEEPDRLPVERHAPILVRPAELQKPDRVEVDTSKEGRWDAVTACAAAYAKGEKPTRAQLAAVVEGNRGLVAQVAHQYIRSCKFLELEDLMQSGTLGLLRALETFDPSLGYTFTTYATQWIRQRIARAKEDEERTVRVPVHRQHSIKKLTHARHRLRGMTGDRAPTVEELAGATGLQRVQVERALETSLTTPASLDAVYGDGDATLGDRTADEDAESAEDSVEREEREATARALLARLPERLRTVMRGRMEGKILEEIGDELGLSKGRIQQLEADALGMLRRFAHQDEIEAQKHVSGRAASAPKVATPSAPDTARTVVAEVYVEPRPKRGPKPKPASAAAQALRAIRDRNEQRRLAGAHRETAQALKR